MQIIDHGGARIAALHDKKTGSWQYVVSDPVSRKCAIIDPVWDFDEKAAATSTRNADAILDYVKAEGLTVEWLLDTHPHADHFSAAPFLNEKLGAPTAIGERSSASRSCGRTSTAWTTTFRPMVASGTDSSRLATRSLLATCRRG